MATAIYALWPAGVAMASVVGTDVPAAALIVAALALLAALAPARPLASALAFGAAMGLAAWVRAVALPLSALSIFDWLARRVPLRRALLYTGAGVAAALLVLLPWGIRHLRQSGALYFTDDHGGITALIGANPNSEGSYTRALNRLFKDVTGRSVLDEPHHATDLAAYAIVREWTRFEPRYTLGLVALKAERLFDPEVRLLYWPIFRPGVLVGRRAAWFAAHHHGIDRRWRWRSVWRSSAWRSPGSPSRSRAAAGRFSRCSPFSWPSGRRTPSSSQSRAIGCRSRCWRFRSWRWRSARSRRSGWWSAAAATASLVSPVSSIHCARSGPRWRCDRCLAAGLAGPAGRAVTAFARPAPLGRRRGGDRRRDAAAALEADAAVFASAALARRRRAERACTCGPAPRGGARAQARLGGGVVDPGTYLFAVKIVDEALEAVRLVARWRPVRPGAGLTPGDRGPSHPRRRPTRARPRG